MIPNEAIHIIESKSIGLPKGWRFYQYEGRKVFNSIDDPNKYWLQLIKAPEEISDYDLKRSDIIETKDICIEINALNHPNAKALMNHISEQLRKAISEIFR